MHTSFILFHIIDILLIVSNFLAMYINKRVSILCILHNEYYISFITLELLQSFLQIFCTRATLRYNKRPMCERVRTGNGDKKNIIFLRR